MKGYNRNTASKKKLKLKGKALYTTEDCEVHVLASFEDKGLIVIEDEIRILGSFAIVFPKDKSYVVMNSIAMYKIDPESIRNETIGEYDYYVFKILAGNPVVTDSRILVEGDLVYDVMNMYYFLGRIPWFISYEKGDVTQLFSTASEHSGVMIDKVMSILSIISAAQARDKSDVNKLIRYTGEIKDKNLTYVSLVHHNVGVTHNFNKITGAYQSEGLSSAIVKKDIGRATVVEEIIRA